MAIKFKSGNGTYRVFDGGTMLGYAYKKSDGWHVAPVHTPDQWRGPYNTRKQAGSALRKSNG